MRTFALIFIAALAVSATSHADSKPILLIGDSLTCGPFGVQMATDLAKKNGTKVTLYCSIGSAPANWIGGYNAPGQKCGTITRPIEFENIKLEREAAGGKARTLSGLPNCPGGGALPKLETLLAKHKGNRILVALGTNSAGCELPGKPIRYCKNARAPHNYQTMAQMVSDASSECEWIGPPHFQPSLSKGWPAGHVKNMEDTLETYVSSLKERVESFCPYQDSRSFTSSSPKGITSGDGIHRFGPAAISWADGMSAKLSSGGAGRTRGKGLDTSGDSSQ